MSHFSSVLNMTGQGTEYLFDAVTGELMAVFFDGSLSTVSPKTDASQADIETIIIAA